MNCPKCKEELAGDGKNGLECMGCDYSTHELDERLVKQFEYENEILEVIDNVDNFTRSDLQGVISAIVMKIRRESKGGE